MLFFLSRLRQRFDVKKIKKIGESVKALALCHNVTPVHEFPNNGEASLESRSPEGTPISKKIESRI